MSCGGDKAAREQAVARARANAPFLREALIRRPDIAELFFADGSEAALAQALTAQADEVGVELRRRRTGLALAVALGDLAGELGLEQVTAALSDFADEAIERALVAALQERAPGAATEGLAVVALGKLGSHELNYSSDVDLILLFDPERLARRERDEPGEAAVRICWRMIQLLQERTADGYVVRVDLRLRPSPEVTPIALSVNAAISHYESSALPWERAAFIRARACAGDRSLGQNFLDAIGPFVWRRSLDFGVIEDVREISARIRDHYSQGAQIGPGYDLKRGRGGIREVEFFAQIQQMIHGGRDPALRCPATLDALAALGESGHLDVQDAVALSDAYRLLRTVEHRVQMIEDAQTHLLPSKREALDSVGRLHGLEDGRSLVELLRPHVERAEALFDSLAPDREGRLSNDPDILLQELAELGFADPAVAARRVADWRSGRARSLRSSGARSAFEAMLPGLLRAIAGGPDPERALNRLADIIDRLSSGINLYRLLDARPALARLLAKLLAHAPALSDQLARRPDLIDGLLDESSFAAPPPSDEVAKMLSSAMRGLPYDVALDRARRLVNERRFALGVQLIDLRRDPVEVAAGYARIAEGALVALAQAAVDEFEASHGRFANAEMVVLGLGRLGGCALTQASDLDLIYVYTPPAEPVSDGPKPLGPADYFNRLASRISAALSVPTAAGPLYEVDTRLRPEGSTGMLAVSLEAFARYQREEAWTWEHMALCRARPLFGSDEAMRAAGDLIDSVLRLQRDPIRVAADAAKMRAEMARHKPPAGAFDVKLGPGGLVDLEFAVHVLQLTRHVGLDPRLGVAVKALAEMSLLPAKVVSMHDLLTRMLVMMRLISPGGSDPEGETRDLLARGCGFDKWHELVAAHDEARQFVGEAWASIRDGIRNDQ
ncbi:MAG TPA: bifunctional [glutamine synthetase] adenylyltransferase/[glutamine synthetase]-adenylyl-L-tyrosine phosphorylase [Sphingomicrobium sp.]|nr:bifunctional [glutamine synthetase] adenylyltransferase/[glutamine synthetase]-adenylyl-L-tyrosine phosphorylase [Sphingomicrobium sp.]